VTASAKAVQQPLSAAIRPLEEVDREHIFGALRHTWGNRAAAARLLGIGEATMHRYIGRERAAGRLPEDLAAILDRHKAEAGEGGQS